MRPDWTLAKNARFFYARLVNYGMIKKCFSLSLLCAFAPAFAAAEPDDAPALRARAAVLTDAATGTVLYQKAASERIPPASLTKLMTIHVALAEAPRRGVSRDSIMDVPPEAWARNQPPRSSLMWLDEGQRVTFDDLLLGLAVASGNDAAVAVALNFAPTVEQFALMMTNAARDLGLTDTVFVEPSGISEENWTTAAEFARFCRVYIREHPENLSELHSVPVFSYPRPENVSPARRNRPGTITQGNRIGLLTAFPGVDGLKTGYIDEAGYNIALTAERDGTRFIAVLLGVPAELGAYWGPRYRDADGIKLLEWGYQHYKTLRLAYPAFPDARVWKGAKSKIRLLPGLDGQEHGEIGAFTVPHGRGGGITQSIELFRGISAPLPVGAPLGQWTLFDEYGELARVPLIAAEAVERGGLLKRIWDSIVMFFTGVKSA